MVVSRSLGTISARGGALDLMFSHEFNRIHLELILTHVRGEFTYITSWLSTRTCV